MKRIAVLGNSVAGIRAIEEIRREDRESEITAFFEDGIFPFLRESLEGLLFQKGEEAKVLYRPKEFYAANKINLVLEKKIIKIDFKKNQIITDDKKSFPYDLLLVTNTPRVGFPGIRGNTKMGIFSVDRFNHIREMSEVLALIETVAIEADNLNALAMACQLCRRQKEVIWILSSSGFLGRYLDNESARFVMHVLEENTVRIIKENAIEEILGEGEVKAIRLKTGKVIASQIVLLEEQGLDLRLFDNAVLQIGERGILVDCFMQTNLKNVFAAGEIIEFKDKDNGQGRQVSSVELEEQGRIAGLAMLGQRVIYQPPLWVRSLNLMELPLTLIGQCRWQEGYREFAVSSMAPKSYQKIFTQNNKIVGGILINAQAPRDKIIRLINDDIDLLGLEERFLEETVSYEKFLDLLREKRNSGQANQDLQAMA